jgi:tetratricopeptide (TPR) repeat protein
MRKWIAGVSLGLAVLSLATAGFAQDNNDAAKANALYKEGKLLDALPFYEALAKENPNEWLYAERLAGCLSAASKNTNDPAAALALRTRERDEAKRAIALGDTNLVAQMMAGIDPSKPVEIAPASAASALIQEAEKAFSAGDFATAMARYIAAANADPKLYEAPLFAGDTAFRQGDLKTAALWFARAIAVNPDRETAYRYWGDAILKYGNDPMAAREKFIDAIVAEPYSRLAWQGIKQWAQLEKAVLMAPKIERPEGPVVDPKNPKGLTIHVDPNFIDEKKHPGGSAWLGYALARANYRNDQFKKDYPDEKDYRHSLKEEDTALSLVITMNRELKTKPADLDESLRNLVELSNAGMLDCWILINGADQGIAQDYDAYRQQHRQLLHDYLSRFVVHGGVNPAQ